MINANDNFATTATLLVWLDPSGEQVTGGVTRNTLSAAPTPVVSENLTTATDGSITGTVDVTAARAFTIAGWVQTSRGRFDTTVTQDIDFSNAQSFVINASTYDQAITQATTISSETFTFGPQGQYTQKRAERWPLSVAIAFVEASDGSSTQTTTIGQELTQDEQTYWGSALVGLEHLDSVVSPTDTLNFDANGNFIGNAAQWGGQSYFSYGLGTCVSLQLGTRGGVLRTQRGGWACTPNNPGAFER